MAAETQATQTQGFSESCWESQILRESQPTAWGKLSSKVKNLPSFELFKEKFTAGREEQSDICFTLKNIDEKFWVRISKAHFEITRELNQHQNTPVYIQDLSRNGTFINGERIGIQQKRILRNKDVISLSDPRCKAFLYTDLFLTVAPNVPKEITSKYHISQKLGAGACGEVFLIYDCRTCIPYAMKRVEKHALGECSRKALNDPERVVNEVKIMKALDHPCVVKMHDIVDKPEAVFIVLELMKGGDLLSRIKTAKTLTENNAKLYFYQICRAVKYLHDKGITHRDLKPDNVLLLNSDNETLVKVSDFGMSKFVQNNTKMITVCGTMCYVAPEILSAAGSAAYTKKVDIWSLGVLLFTCLSGNFPFIEKKGSPIAQQIKCGDFKFNNNSWKNVSSLAKSLIVKMLTVNPHDRPTIDQILSHPWLNDPEVIGKAHKLMRTATDSSDEENNSEPPVKGVRLE